MAVGRMADTAEKRMPLKWRVVLVALAWMAGGCSSRPDIPSRTGTILAGYLEAPGLDEISGLAASRIRPDLLWAVADSGNPPLLYAVGIDGAHRGAYRIEGVDNRDWEDLASFSDDGRPCLLIADTGDNDARHPVCFLHILREPELPPGTAAARGILKVERTIRFVYEDGPRDCEAVAVDPEEGQVFLLSKREVPVSLYRLSMGPAAGSAIQIARKVTDVAQIPGPTSEDLRKDRRYGRYGSQVTAMDLAADGSGALVLTYKNAYRYPRRPGERWEDVFRQSPERIPLPPLRQAEALCLSPAGKSIFVSSEQRPNPLLRLEPDSEGRY